LDFILSFQMFHQFHAYFLHGLKDQGKPQSRPIKAPRAGWARRCRRWNIF